MSSALAKLQEYYFDKPYEFVCDIIFEGNVILDGPREKRRGPTGQQKKVLEACGKSARDRRLVSVKSGHGTGKTCLAAWVILWFLFTHPYSKTGCTAPTERQLKNGLWGELTKWINRSEICKSFFKWKSETVEVKGFGMAWAAELRAAYRPENLAGLHGEGGTLIIADEASGILDDNIWDTVSGALSDVGSFLMMIGNPTQIRGNFHRSFSDKSARARCITLSCEDKDYRGDPNYAKEMASKYGRDSDRYRVRVLGEFPIDMPDAFIRLRWLQDCYNRDFMQSLTPVVSIDPADQGDDDTEICASVGYRLVYRRTMAGETDGPMNAQGVLIAVHYLRQNCKEFGFHKDVPITIVIDSTGLGAATRDAMRLFERVENLKIICVNAAESGNDEYERMSDLLWGNLKTLISHISIPRRNDSFEENRITKEDRRGDGFDDSEYFEELEDQLCGRKYSINPSSGKIILESKADLKRRGKPSPNMADALALLMVPFMRYGIDSKPNSGKRYSIKASSPYA